MITKLLVANRGEIARRVFRTCRDMGIATVAVYSEADADALFVKEADEAVALGGAVPADSYLRADRVIAAAQKVGAQAIHPGYGFLSENAQFAADCAEAGINFIGPSIEAIELMGSKLTAREMMEAAGVPVLPGRDLTGVAESEIPAIAEEVGWPILVKASFGGGGRGMRIVREPAELLEAIASARREAGAAFGNDTVFLEHYVDNPRHIEIQIFGDTHGTIVHLNERECSIQRRHQKIIEESPSPVVDEELRATMGVAAVNAGRALDYIGAGTVEFLVAPDKSFYFLEVNTRLQVEHPVTELVTGLDLVRLQIDVANGEVLPPEAVSPGISGHAVEARIYAEDAAKGFLPAAGTLNSFIIAQEPGIRLDSGVNSGDVVSTNYDPMLAKVISYGRNRSEATARLARALRRSTIHGVTTNRELLVGVLESKEFGTGEIDTHFLERKGVESLIEVPAAELVNSALVAAAVVDQAVHRADARQLAGIGSGFRNNRSQLQSRDYQLGEDTYTVGYAVGREPTFEIDGREIDAAILDVSSSSAVVVVRGTRRSFEVTRSGQGLLVSWASGSLSLTEIPRFSSAEDAVVAGSLTAPMPGTVSRVEVAEGDVVSEGQVVIVIEAMKMEHSIRADLPTTVLEVPVTVGQAVDTGQVLIVLDEKSVEVQ